MTVDRLVDRLYVEANRRDELGHHAVAHELRKRAGEVSSALRFFEASKLVQS